MKVFITGINGFVGPELARLIRSEAPQAEIWGQAWGEAGRDRLEELAPDAQVVDAELTNEDAVDAVFDDVAPDLVFHLAAASSVAGSWSSPAAIFQINAVGQIHLFEALLRRRLRPLIVVASSAEVYGANSSPRITENAPLAPVSPYGVSKATQDLLAAQYHSSHKLPTVRLRLFNHTGAGQRQSFVVPSFARQIARIEAGLEAPRLNVGNLEAVRDFSDVRDVVRAYWLAAVRAEAGAVYNVCSGHPVHIRELLDGLLSLSSAAIEVTQDPDRMRASDVPHLVGDPSRFARTTDWRPQIPLRSTLETVLEWWRSRP